MVDVAGLSLTPEERERLGHPLVGAVILFKRNCASPVQLRALTAEIRAIRKPELLIAVDQEGGRVQRFVDGFTRLPPMRTIGELHAKNPELARHLAHATGVVIGAELVAHGIDFSFAPVLDLDYGRPSGAIGDRAFHRDPAIVAQLGGALAEGLRSVGVAAVGKHFPGHGYVAVDSHREIAVDARDFASIEADDLVPFRMLAQRLAGVMPAHVTYPRADASPAGLSRFWIGEVLRKRLGFAGMVFSDDLSMEAASVGGDVVARARAALDAGCNMVLVCNAPGQAGRVLHTLGEVTLDLRLAESMRAKDGGGSLECGRARELLASWTQTTT
jgi:beta-N-acetylhexosaminidase